MRKAGRTDKPFPEQLFMISDLFESVYIRGYFFLDLIRVYPRLILLYSFQATITTNRPALAMRDTLGFGEHTKQVLA